MDRVRISGASRRSCFVDRRCLAVNRARIARVFDVEHFVGAKIPVWKWTEAVTRTDVPPLTKLVCLVIATRLNASDAGRGWIISVADIMAASGLSNRAVALHVQNARDAGLLEIVRLHNGHGHRTGTRYTPTFPLVPGDEPAQDAGDTSSDPPSREPEAALSDAGDTSSDPPSRGLSDPPSPQVLSIAKSSHETIHESPPHPPAARRKRRSRGAGEGGGPLIIC